MRKLSLMHLVGVYFLRQFYRSIQTSELKLMLTLTLHNCQFLLKGSKLFRTLGELLPMWRLRLAKSRLLLLGALVFFQLSLNRWVMDLFKLKQFLSRSFQSCKGLKLTLAMEFLLFTKKKLSPLEQ